MSLINNYVSYVNGLPERQRTLARAASLLSVVAVTFSALMWVVQPSGRVLEKIEHDIGEVRNDVAQLKKAGETFSRRLTEVEKRNLELVKMTKGKISLSAPSEERQEMYRNSYKKFVKAELGGLPKVRQYWSDPMKLPSSELRCLAVNIYHEAGRESYPGMVAVGQVTLNRFQRGKWGNICDTVYADAQFSWTLDPKRVKETPTGLAWDRSKKVARDVARGLRVEGLENAVFYHANYIPGPKWLPEVKLRHYIGAHLFYDQRG